MLHDLTIIVIADGGNLMICCIITVNELLLKVVVPKFCAGKFSTATSPNMEGNRPNVAIFIPIGVFTANGRPPANGPKGASSFVALPKVLRNSSNGSLKSKLPNVPKPNGSNS
eukprot:CCRYP_008214-RA/>CCRYP_008214-RA protein AED:0.47 eAED:0.78 QI:121/0/0.5/1/0/0/2/0/112